LNSRICRNLGISNIPLITTRIIIAIITVLWELPMDAIAAIKIGIIVRVCKNQMSNHNL